jgi:hypothetical protein
MIEEGWSTHINQDLSEGYYSNGPSGDYRLCYNPSVLTPNWGADVTEPVAGENVGGLLCFLVPAGKGTIVVKGYTDSDEAKMAIRLGLADAEPMTMAGRAGGEWGPPTSKEFTYAFDNTQNGKVNILSGLQVLTGLTERIGTNGIKKNYLTMSLQPYVQ